jgi:hypothetical protein
VARVRVGDDALQVGAHCGELRRAAPGRAGDRAGRARDPRRRTLGPLVPQRPMSPTSPRRRRSNIVMATTGDIAGACARRSWGAQLATDIARTHPPRPCRSGRCSCRIRWCTRPSRSSAPAREPPFRRGVRARCQARVGGIGRASLAVLRPEAGVRASVCARRGWCDAGDVGGWWSLTRDSGAYARARVRACSVRTRRAESAVVRGEAAPAAAIPRLPARVHTRRHTPAVPCV